MANSEDQGEMPHKAAFHQGLHCFKNNLQGQKISICRGFVVCLTEYHLKYRMDNSILVWENPSECKGLS